MSLDDDVPTNKDKRRVDIDVDSESTSDAENDEYVDEYKEDEQSPKSSFSPYFVCSYILFALGQCFSYVLSEGKASYQLHVFFYFFYSVAW